MNINPNYSADDPNKMNNIELAETAFKAIEDNILAKVEDQLETIDFIGYASVRVIMEDIARKAQAYDDLMDGQLPSQENDFSRN